MLKRFILLAFCAVLFGPPAEAESRDHIRVVLDLSKSMRANDPGRMAILATLLLYDLAQPNPSRGDSFKIIPFKPDWTWKDPKAAPPTDNGPFITAEGLERGPFAARVRSLAYEARQTHFYPGLRAALADLKATPEGDSRTIVLVTDGVPEALTQDKEARSIEKELLPQLEAQKARLYVLGFSAEAVTHKAFFDLMTRNDTLGKSFFDPKGEHLLETMLDVFGESLGYEVDRPLPLPGVSSLVLSAGGGLPKAAVVVLAQGAATAPGLRLAPPPNLRNGLASETLPGAAYTLGWVLSPAPGSQAFATDIKRGSVAVLRPIKVRLAIRPEPPHTQAARTMAGKPLPLQVEASNEYGGAPGRLDLQFRLQGPGWTERPEAPPQPGQTLPGTAGVIFRIPALFPANEPPEVLYQGSVSVEARRGLKVLGRLPAPHPVEVYPFLALAPFPRLLEIDPKAAALHRGDERCAAFRLSLGGGHLPHAPAYTLKATLVPADPASMNREFRRSSFTLDGLPLRFSGHPGDFPGAWYEGKPLSSAQLLEENHELCMKVGSPRSTDPAKPLDLPVRLVFAQSPYDDFDVIEPLVLRVRLAAPALSRLDGVLLALLAAWALAALWYLRGGPRLAPDLVVALGPDEDSARMTKAASGTVAWQGGWRGMLHGERPILDGQGRPLAWIRPLENRLYALRLPPGARLENVETGELARSVGNLAMVSVHRVYRLTVPNRPACRLRLAFGGQP